MNSKELIEENQKVIDSSYLTLLKSYRPGLSGFDPHFTNLWYNVKQLLSHFVSLLNDIFMILVGCVLMLCMPLWILFVPFMLRRIARDDIKNVELINERMLDRFK